MNSETFAKYIILGITFLCFVLIIFARQFTEFDTTWRNRLSKRLGISKVETVTPFAIGLRRYFFLGLFLVSLYIIIFKI